MLKFFRRIRQRLLDEGQLKKYLVYAIGEILLVVIGILIALQINTWSQERQNNKLEKRYLYRFLQDLEQDSLDLSVVVANANVSIKLCSSILQDALDRSIPLQQLDNEIFKHSMEFVRIENGEASYKNKIIGTDVNSLGQQLTQIGIVRIFDLTTATYDDLLATGNIEVIRTPSLRNSIQKYYNMMAGQLDFADSEVMPAKEYYETLLKDIGIVPNSDFSMEKIQQKAEGNENFPTAIQYLLYSNLRHLSWSQMISEEIQAMKQEIIEELSNKR